MQRGQDPPGRATLVLQRDGATVVINDVPAQVCDNEPVAECVLTAAAASARPGVRVEIRDYVAA